MRYFGLVLFFAALASAASDSPVFNNQGELAFPSDYREWVYLSSGLGMTYGPAATNATQTNPLFDNVFVNRSAYEQFKQSGKWPEGTMFVLEIRYSTSHGSINRGGSFQTDAAAHEVEVKDSQRFPGGWAYFDFGGGLSARRASAPALPRTASCFGCHEANGAVENTFTQFYPVALEIARAKGTLKPGHEKPFASPVAVLQSLRADNAPAGRILSDLKTAEPTSAALTPGNLNTMGYSLLQAGLKQQAVGVFEWAAHANPNSANALDSLADAYESAGQSAKALETARRGLTLLEKDPAANERNRTLLLSSLQGRVQELQSTTAPASDWIQLFNGRDLTGWTPKIRTYAAGENFANTFRVRDGKLVVDVSGYDEFNNRFGHLFWKDPYSYYTIAVEYRFIGDQAKGGPGWAVRNSGIMVAGQTPESMGKDQDFPISIEVQLLGGNGTETRHTANLCTPGTNVVMGGKLITTHCVQSTSQTYHGDQWVRVEATVLGSERIVHRVNGEKVLEYEQPQIGGGAVNAFDPAAKKDGTLLESGTISLQSESHPLEFRKVELLDLAGCMDPKAKNYKSYFVKSVPSRCRF